MSEQKLLTRNTEYIIYGAGECGETYALNLLKAGNTVVGFLDKNKEGYSQKTQLPIYSVGKEPWDKTEKLVIISLANGNLHLNVVRELFALGYRYFVFLPLGVQVPYEHKKYMTDLYNEIIESGSKKVVEIDNAEEYLYGDYSDDDCIIEETEEKMTVWVSQEIIFTESYEEYAGDKGRLPKNRDIFDAHITARKGYFELFKFLSGQKAVLDCYMEDYFGIIAQEKKQEKLQDRELLYKVFEKEFERGNMQFFIDGAPEATWNKKGYFNLVGGHHRTIYLLHKDLHYCPLKITRQDYESWKNNNKFEKLKRWFYTTKELEFKGPIPHPLFISTFSNCLDDVGTLVLPIMFFLLDEINCRTAVDISECDGYFARLAYRAAIPEISCFVKEIEKVKLINEMLYVNDINVENKDIFKEHEKYDIIFAMDFAKTRGINIQENMIKHLDMVTKKALILEVEESEIKSIIADTNFNTYKFLHRRCKNGKIVEVGAFIKKS